MSYGIATRNFNSFINLHENRKTYCYLGKYEAVAFGNLGTTAITFTCVGRPVLFLSVPATPGVMTLASCVNLGGNTWRAYLNYNGEAYNYSTHVLPLYLRVFGRLDLNFPLGAGDLWGMRAWGADGALVFDSGVPQLRLKAFTGDSYFTIPCDPNDVSAFTDVPTLALGFSLYNTSVCTFNQGRGMTTDTYATGDTEAPYQTDITYYMRGYSFSGSNLRAEWFSYDTSRSQGNGGGGSGNIRFGGTQSCQPTFIDNAQFP